MSQHKYNEAYDKGYEAGKQAAFNDWIFMNYDELSRKEQIELLMNDLQNGNKPDDSTLRDIRKTMGNYAINKYVDMLAGYNK